jgi:hypothetical protein
MLDERRMSTACFARVPQRGTSRLSKYILLTFQEVTPLSKTRNQLIYCARGQAENEIKDHKRSLKSDRTSCHRFEANQFRVFLHSAAYGLLDTLRREVFKTAPWACATMETIQLHVFKLGARVHELTDRIKISLPSSCPVAPLVRRSLTLLACVRLV